jgi:hypothetical protein
MENRFDQLRAAVRPTAVFAGTVFLVSWMIASGSSPHHTSGRSLASAMASPSAQFRTFLCGQAIGTQVQYVACSDPRAELFTVAIVDPGAPCPANTGRASSDDFDRCMKWGGGSFASAPVPQPRPSVSHAGYENPAPGDDGSYDCPPGGGAVWVGSNDPANLDGDGDGWGCE